MITIFETLTQSVKVVAVACGGGGDFFGLPHWYKYACGHDFRFLANEDGPSDIPLVGLAILEIMLRIAAVVAVGYVVFGAIKYQTSQGDPKKIEEAKSTIINALVGMVISALAISIVAFIGNRLG
jgi:hypothetical protein